MKRVLRLSACNKERAMLAYIIFVLGAIGFSGYAVVNYIILKEYVVIPFLSFVLAFLVWFFFDLLSEYREHK